MKDEEKSKEQLIRELLELRQQVADLKERSLQLGLAKKLLKENNEKYRLLVENAPSGIYEIDFINLKFTTVNDVMCEYTGYTKEELLSMNPFDILSEESKLHFSERLRNGFSGKSFPESHEFKIKGKNGREYWSIISAKYKYENGIPVGASVIAHDITERKKMEEALRESEDRYRRIVETANEGIWIINEKDRIAFANEKIAKMFGYNRDEIIGKSIFDLLNVEEKNIVKASLKRRRQGVREQFDLKFRCKDGTELWTIVSVAPIFSNKNKYKGALAMITDITEHKRAEKALQESEERLRSIFQQSPIGIELYDSAGMLIDANQSCLDIFGISNFEEVRGFKLYDDPNLPGGAKEKLLKGESVRYEYQFDFEKVKKLKLYKTTKAGCIYIDCLITPLSSKGNPYHGILVQVQDITERKQSVKTLRENERFLSSIFTSIQDSLYVIDSEFNIIRVNQSVERTYSNALPLLGKKCYEVFHGDNKICEGCPCAQTLKTAESAHAVIRTKDSSGNIIGCKDNYCHPFIDEATGEIRGVIVYSRDITDKINLEKEMARLERLNLIGEMAASIGHEVRNPMTTVRGFLQMLRGKEECSKYGIYFNLMIEELDRANSIITEFLSLAKNKSLDLEIKNINSILNTLSPLISANAANADRDIILELGDIPDLFVNEKEIRQLILNLVKNGLEAMENRGSLTIKTFADDDEVVLSVQDQGNGINPDLYDLVGTPFFTTKENGTGLGLAVCYGIASRNKATIKFKTSSTGTTFSVRFKK